MKAEDNKTGRKAQFAMVFHCHQPVFNFEKEVEAVYGKSYLPLVRTLGDFPEIKATFHFSGNLFEWLESRHPEFIDLLKTLLRRGQIELLGGGCYEPVMVIIPEGDRARQLAANNEILERIFGIVPRGAWLTERVWEPSIADTLASNGMGFSLVDDYHLLNAGKEEANIFTPCRVSGEEKDIVLIPFLSRLRYSMPFRAPEVAISQIRQWQKADPEKHNCFVFADDGEKFGAWPHTYRWVHRKGWLRSFFRELADNAGWLKTVTCSEMIETSNVTDIGRIPASSYAEMMEWSGGDFRNFLGKYSEADRMYKRMTSLSGIIDGMGSRTSAGDARKELMKAQTGCAYWHGTFGGVYQPHLREGVYKHLIEAENIVDKSQASVSGVRSIERDEKETLVRNRYIDLFISPEEGGALCELDDRVRKNNILNSMARGKEEYHNRVYKDPIARAKKARSAVVNGEFADLYDVLGVAEKKLDRVLAYDDHKRYSFLTHIWGEGISTDKCKTRPISGSAGFLKGKYFSFVEENKDFITVTQKRRDPVFGRKGKTTDLEVIKKVTVGNGPAVRFSQKIVRHAGEDVLFRYGLEFNVLVCDKYFMTRPRSIVDDKLKLQDMYSGSGIEFFLDTERDIRVYPIYSVNETESGLKKTFQGLSVLFNGTPAKLLNEAGSDVIKITLALG